MRRLTFAIFVLLVALDTARSQQPDRTGFPDLKPLTELGTDKYQGSPGGLYPDGKNEPPLAHLALGLAFAKQVQPRNRVGNPDAEGKIVLLSIGMSNTTQEFSAFMQLAQADRQKKPRLTLVDGAQGGMAAAQICDESSNSGKRFWTTVDQRLKNAGVTA